MTRRRYFPPHKCKYCGEDNPNNFYTRSGSDYKPLAYCKACYKERYSTSKNKKEVPEVMQFNKGKSWTFEDNQYLVSNKDKMTAYELGVTLGRSTSAIYNQLRKLGGMM